MKNKKNRGQDEMFIVLFFGMMMIVFIVVATSAGMA
jgi:hypothetical protein